MSYLAPTIDPALTGTLAEETTIGILEDPPSEETTGIAGWAIALIVIACIILVVGIIGLIIYFSRIDSGSKMFLTSTTPEIDTRSIRSTSTSSISSSTSSIPSSTSSISSSTPSSRSTLSWSDRFRVLDTLAPYMEWITNNASKMDELINSSNNLNAKATELNAKTDELNIKYGEALTEIREKQVPVNIFIPEIDTAKITCKPPEVTF